jgi:GNAT superfamily N-acetyltransferase
VELREKDLASYVALVAPDRPDALDELRERVASGERRLADLRVSPDLAAALRVAAFGPRSAEVLGPFGEDGAAAGLVPEAIERARSLGAEAISARPHPDRIGPRYRAALLAAGFRDLGERVEFEASVEDLPDDTGTPLVWRDLDAVGLDAAVAVLGEIAVGDPHGAAERENPRRELLEWLADPVLTDGPECVQVGFEDDRPVAFVCAQVWPERGWSRITHMGVVPDARGRGLGRWAHRHGFRMIREQGGTRYQGGTSTDNAAMLRLFEIHGCAECERMLEFEWRAAP